MIYFTSRKDTTYLEGSDIQICDVRFIKDYLKKLDLVGVDTETTGFDPHKDKVLTLQLGHKENQFVIDASTIDITIFKDILEEKNLILQNAKFDLRFLNKLGIFPNKIYDTYLAEVKLTQGILGHKRDLESLAIRYCETKEVDKSLRSLIHYKGLIKEVIAYAGNDVKYLHEIREKQLKLAKEKDLEKAINLENRFCPALAYTEFCGMYFNPKDWDKKTKQSYDKVQQARKKLNNYIIDNNLSKYIDKQLDLFSTDKKVTINWNSSDQVKPLLKDLGVNVVVVEKGKKKESIDASNLVKQTDVSPIIPLYLNYKKWEKDYTTYGQSFIKKIHKETGRIHTQFTQIVDTGRMASGGKNRSTKEEYVNFQNIPATPKEKNREEGMVYARQCIQAQGDNVFVNADYSGQEQIILANKSKDKDLIEFYHKDLGDMHSYVSSKIFPELRDVPLKDIEKFHKDKRQIAKSAGFALNYGGTGWTVANNINISHEEGNRVEKAYFETFPGLKDYYDLCEKNALSKGYILIDELTGSKYYISGFEKLKDLLLVESLKNKEYWNKFTEEKKKNSSWYLKEKEKNSYVRRWKGQIRRNALNFPIQGTAASITKIAGVYLYDWILKNNYQNKIKIVNIIHDELLVECSKELAETVSDKLKIFMEKAGEHYCKIVPLKAVPEISLFWNH